MMTLQLLTFYKENTSYSVQLFGNIPFLSEKSYCWWSPILNADNLWNKLSPLAAPLLISLMPSKSQWCAFHCHLKLKLQYFANLVLVTSMKQTHCRAEYVSTIQSLPSYLRYHPPRCTQDDLLFLLQLSLSSSLASTVGQLSFSLHV